MIAKSWDYETWYEDVWINIHKNPGCGPAEAALFLLSSLSLPPSPLLEEDAETSTLQDIMHPSQDMPHLLSPPSQ